MLGLEVCPGSAEDVRGLLEYILCSIFSVSSSRVISYVQSPIPPRLKLYVKGEPR
jgi:hypothetical protein